MAHAFTGFIFTFRGLGSVIEGVMQSHVREWVLIVHHAGSGTLGLPDQYSIDLEEVFEGLEESLVGVRLAIGREGFEEFGGFHIHAGPPPSNAPEASLGVTGLMTSSSSIRPSCLPSR